MATGVKKSRNQEKADPRAARFDGLAKEVAHDDGSGRLGKSDLAHSLGFLLRLASGVSQSRLGERLGALNLRSSLYSVLLIIRENPGLKQQEVGRTLSIQQPNLVALVNDLAERGLVRREVNADDRRSYSLVLTPAGEKLLAQADKVHEENERKLAEAIAPLNVKEFEAALRRVLDI